MNARDLRYVRDTIESEGFGYAFVDYSDFSDIEDEEIHRLRKAYVDAHEKLAKYLGV